MKAIVWIIIIIVLVFGGMFLFSDREDVGALEPSLTFALSGLETLSSGHYEGWAIFGEEKVSTGKFNIGDDLEFSSSRDLSTADKIVITIEPDGDTDEVPSGIVVLAGDVSGDAASLGFPVDLSGAAGNYILATPTNGDDSDETSGVWFLKLPPPLQVGLVIPQLPDGWVYEGWVVNQGAPITTGRFSSPEGIDGFDGFSGSEGGPPFPGEDYIVNAPAGLTFPINLADGESKVVISVEPDLNGSDPTGDAPFAVKPLVGDVPEGAEDHTNYQMNQNLVSVPSGTATIGS
jgi:hypothetical protein